MPHTNPVFHAVCFTTSILVFLFVVTSVESTLLSSFLCVNAIVSATWHAWRWATELEREAAYRAASRMLVLDVGGAVAGAAIVFTTHPPFRAPLAASGALAASSMLSSRLHPSRAYHTPWPHMGAHGIFALLAAAYALARAAELVLDDDGWEGEDAGLEESYFYEREFVCVA